MMKSYAKKICAAIGGGLLVTSSLVSLACTSVACTSSGSSNHSDSPTSSESSPSAIPFADLQAQANLIDNVDDAIKFMNQSLAKYYSFEMFKKDFETSIVQGTDMKSIYDPIIHIDDSNGEYSWESIHLYTITPANDHTITLHYQRDALQRFKNHISNNPYRYLLFKAMQNFDYRVAPILIKEQATGDVKMVLGNYKTRVRNDAIQIEVIDPNHYETTHQKADEQTTVNVVQNLIFAFKYQSGYISLEHFGFVFPLLKNFKVSDNSYAAVQPLPNNQANQNPSILSRSY